MYFFIFLNTNFEKKNFNANEFERATCKKQIIEIYKSFFYGKLISEEFLYTDREENNF